MKLKQQVQKKRHLDKDDIWSIGFIVVMLVTCFLAIIIPVLTKETRQQNQMYEQLRQMGFDEAQIASMFGEDLPTTGFTIADVKEPPKFKQYNVGDILDIPFGVKIGDVIELEPYIDENIPSSVIRDNLFN